MRPVVSFELAWNCLMDPGISFAVCDLVTVNRI